MFDDPNKKLHSMRFFRGAGILRPESMSNLSGEGFEEELRGRTQDLLSHPKADSTKVGELELELIDFALDVENMIIGKTAENAAFDISQWIAETNLLNWHYQRREKYPLIFAAAALIALGQSSSGAVERAFSRFCNLFDVDQQSMYWDEDSSGKILGIFLPSTGECQPGRRMVR